MTVELERLRLSQNDYGLLSLLRLLNLLAHSRTSLVRSEAINGSCSRRRRSRLHRRRCPRPPTETRPWDGQTFQMHSNTVYWQWTPFFLSSHTTRINAFCAATHCSLLARTFSKPLPGSLVTNKEVKSRKTRCGSFLNMIKRSNASPLMCNARYQ